MSPTFRRGFAAAAAFACVSVLAPVATSAAAPSVQRRATTSVVDARNDVGTRGNMQRPSMAVTKASIDISKVKMVSGPRAFTTQVWIGGLQTPQAASGNRNQVFGVKVSNGMQFNFAVRSGATSGRLTGAEPASTYLEPWVCGTWQTGSDAAGPYVLLSVPYNCAVAPGTYKIQAYSAVKGRANNEWYDTSLWLPLRVPTY